MPPQGRMQYPFQTSTRPKSSSSGIVGKTSHQALSLGELLSPLKLYVRLSTISLPWPRGLEHSFRPTHFLWSGRTRRMGVEPGWRFGQSLGRVRIGLTEFARIGWWEGLITRPLSRHKLRRLKVLGRPEPCIRYSKGVVRELGLFWCDIILHVILVVSYH
jgi:hypothetical protein